MLKKQIPLLLAAIFMIACSKVQDNNFALKSIGEPTTNASEKPIIRDPKLLSVNPPSVTFKSDDPSPVTNIKPGKFIVDRKNLYYPDKGSYAEGMITVIYKNNYILK